MPNGYPAAQAPILTPDKDLILRSFRGFALYLLLPLTSLAFWWKAAVFPEGGWAFAIVTAAVIAMHLTLLFRRLSWSLRTVISLGVTILAVTVMLSFGISFRRPFYLFRANLAGQWLVEEDLKKADAAYANFSHADLDFADLAGANLSHANLNDAKLEGVQLSGAELDYANLTGASLYFAKLGGADLASAKLSSANLHYANLTGAELSLANLTSANLSGADLTGAKLNLANLTGADLDSADLTGADLSDANLTGASLVIAKLSRAKLSGAKLTGATLVGADGLSQQQLDTACGNAETLLLPGLSVKFCSQQ